MVFAKKTHPNPPKFNSTSAKLVLHFIYALRSSEKLQHIKCGNFKITKKC